MPNFRFDSTTEVQEQAPIPAPYTFHNMTILMVSVPPAPEYPGIMLC